ncbi:hypothetical protein AB0L00_32010 [Actinoallomurus sp. NPDC052308]|uniref:hypothetical protein n=1 Tax=Actinoallomurus sp. NPDC052308 TaxID=3155530 RepID=UPI003431EB62
MATAVLAAAGLGGVATSADAAPRGVVTPMTNIVSCDNPATKVRITDAGGRTTCFSGTGYTAYRINKLVDLEATDFGWVKLYPSGTTDGAIWSFGPNDPIRLSGEPGWTYDMTQICLHC